MGIESDARKRRRRTVLKSVILGSIEAAGIISAGLLIPKVASTILSMTERRDERIGSALARLQRDGYILREKKGFRLTDEGRKYLGHKVRRPSKWDGKWRVIAIDIPEPKKAIRDKLRSILNEAGFVRLQDSLWVHAFDCEDLFTLLRTELRLSKTVTYILAENIANDTALRGHFSLTK